MKTFFIADTHFGHKNILEYCAKTRPFDTIEEHDKILIKNWNSVVTTADRVFVLGDFFMGPGSKDVKELEIRQLLSRLRGTKILIIGNHDLSFSASQWMSMGFNSAVSMSVYNNCLLTHMPVARTEIRGQSPYGRYLANVHGHLHQNGNTPELNASGRFCVSVDCTELHPVDWLTLESRISSSLGLVPIRLAEKVMYAGEQPVLLGLHDDHGMRIKRQTKKVSPKVKYFLEYITPCGTLITLRDDDDDTFTVKSKNFVGVNSYD